MNSSLSTWNATQPGHTDFQGVGTMAASSASPIRLTAASARSKHSRAKATSAGLLPSRAAVLARPLRQR
jgi:hypothetical protein